MAKSSKKKSVKKGVSTEHIDVTSIRDLAEKAQHLEVPEALAERFEAQLGKVWTRLSKIADNLQKAITLDETKAEREEAKAKRVAARRDKLTEQAKKIAEKLAAMNKKS